MSDVVVLIDREQGGRARLASQGLRLHSAFTLRSALAGRSRPCPTLTHACAPAAPMPCGACLPEHHAAAPALEWQPC